MIPDLRGRVALVTGASRGIGRILAQYLASAGAFVVVTARSMDSPIQCERYGRHALPGTLAETVQLIETAGGRCIAIAADLLVDDQRDSLLSRAVSAAGRIEILVNNAGFCEFARFQEMDATLFDRTFDQYLRVPFLMCKAVVPGMRARGAGWIVNISSAGARPPTLPCGARGLPRGNFAYGAAKAALDRLSQGLAEELYDANIAVNVVAPSTFVETPGAKELVPEGLVAEEPGYLAAAVLSMCHLPASERTGLVAYSLDFEPALLNSARETHAG